MKYNRTLINTLDTRSTTENNNDRIIREIEKIKELIHDTEKEEHLARHECKCCYYLYRSRIGGQVTTSKPCSICNECVVYSSTCVDLICKKCAAKLDLCVRCGADINLNEKRDWDEFDHNFTEIVK